MTREHCDLCDDVIAPADSVMRCEIATVDQSSQAGHADEIVSAFVFCGNCCYHRSRDVVMFLKKQPRFKQ